jgi:hypothetical protein
MFHLRYLAILLSSNQPQPSTIQQDCGGGCYLALSNWLDFKNTFQMKTVEKVIERAASQPAASTNVCSNAKVDFCRKRLFAPVRKCNPILARSPSIAALLLSAADSSQSSTCIHCSALLWRH